MCLSHTREAKTIFVYLDNAATSFPKPDYVLRSVREVLGGAYGNPGRSGHLFSRNSAGLVFEAREKLAAFFDLKNCENIVFTHNATYALNMAILGTVAEIRKTDSKPVVVTSVFEHNSVLRPLYALEDEGKITLRIFSPDPNGAEDDFHRLSAQICPRTKLCVLTAASNANGHTFPLERIGKALRQKGVLLIVDASQKAGTEEISLPSIGADMLCAPGHKGLLGVMGGGLIAFSDTCRILPEVILSGGAGVDSLNRKMPLVLPERLEAGTLALPAIAGMKAGTEYLTTAGIREIAEREKEMKALLTDGIGNIRGAVIYEPHLAKGSLLFNILGRDPNELAASLDRDGVMVRAGFHCAPLAHAFLKTGNQGAVRVSPGAFTTRNHVRFAIDKIHKAACSPV